MYIMMLVPCGDDRIIKSPNFNWLLLLFPKKNPVSRRQYGGFKLLRSEHACTSDEA
jgi:hypothetical protein